MGRLRWDRMRSHHPSVAGSKLHCAALHQGGRSQWIAMDAPVAACADTQRPPHPLRRGAESAARDCPARRVGTAPRHHAAAGIQRPPPSSQEVLHLLLLISVSSPLLSCSLIHPVSRLSCAHHIAPPAPPRLGGHPVSPVTTGVATDMSMRPGGGQARPAPAARGARASRARPIPFRPHHHACVRASHAAVTLAGPSHHPVIVFDSPLVLDMWGSPADRLNMIFLSFCF